MQGGAQGQSVAAPVLSSSDLATATIAQRDSAAPASADKATAAAPTSFCAASVITVAATNGAEPGQPSEAFDGAIAPAEEPLSKSQTNKQRAKQRAAQVPAVM